MFETIQRFGGVVKHWAPDYPCFSAQGSRVRTLEQLVQVNDSENPVFFFPSYFRKRKTNKQSDKPLSSHFLSCLLLSGATQREYDYISH